MTNILVSIIISNYKDINNLKLCLKSIKENVHIKGVEVIVVDYGTINLRSHIKRYYQFVKLIQLRNDLGVSAQRNIGALISKGKYLFFLDNDTYVCKDCLEQLIKVLENDPNIAAVQPKTLILTNPKYINTAGGFMNIIGNPCLRGYLEEDKGQYSDISEIFYSQGSGFVIQKDVFINIGMYDPSYYIYFDDTDLCFRIWLYGYRVVYVPNAVLYHKIGLIRKISPRKISYYERNKIITLMKNLESKQLIIYLPIAIIYSIVVRALSAIKHRDIKILIAILRGYLWIVKNIKEIIRKRHYVQLRIRRVSDKFLIRKRVLRGFFRNNC